MSDEQGDLTQYARDGAEAIVNGDGGRSAFLMEQVASIMRTLTVAECEWLSVAVSNGAFSRLLHEPASGTQHVTVESTADGEIWDI